MQMINVGYFQDRTLYYWSRKFGGQLISGESYSKLKPTISINIMDFNLFDTDKGTGDYERS